MRELSEVCMRQQCDLCESIDCRCDCHVRQVPRAETGVMQFEDDWPGVFIRGDNAFYFAMCLRNVYNKLIPLTDPITLCGIQGLLSLLENSDIRTNPNPQKAHLLPSETPTKTEN
jgi:hypothetical protein